MDNKGLIEIAKKAKQNAYAPYSKFSVGAALLCKSGSIYTGCNIENATYGATNCAERTAVFSAVSQGEREFDKIAIVSDTDDETFPCGICRQVLGEFMPQGEVILEDKNGEINTYSVSELLPKMFKL